MNCFNVRELQSLVRKRFFMETINPNIFNNDLNKTLVGLKYKTNSLALNKSNSYLNNKFGINYNVSKSYNLDEYNSNYKIPYGYLKFKNNFSYVDLDFLSMGFSR